MSEFHKSAWADDDFSRNYLEKADAYIVERRKMIALMASAFEHFFHGRSGVRVLDLGCGDGILSEKLLSADTSLSCLLVDASQRMLDRARDRLRSYGGLRFLACSFEEVLSGKVDLGLHDLCVSSFAIHHLETVEKAHLYRYIHDHLNPEGMFINIDMVLPPSAELEAFYFSLWEGWVRQKMSELGIGDEQPGDVMKRYKDPSSMNKPDTLDTQLTALREAGFGEADCCYKNGVFAVLLARKCRT